MKRIFCLILCLACLLPTVTACSKAPEYAQIEERFCELVEASYEVNILLFGEGLPTYERVTDPQSSMKVYREPDLENEGKEKLTYYYEIPDKQYEKVIAFRSSYLTPYSYLEVCTAADTARNPYYIDETKQVWCYLLEDYTEPEFEFFYDDEDPVDYDYVTDDSAYLSVADIKAAAEQVYSADYLSSIYDSLFVGTAAATDSVDGMSARYIDYADEDGVVTLMQSNTYDALITEQRQFDFSTAKMVKPSNREYVNIEIESYLPSKPEDRQTVRISMILQDGTWMLDSATY